MVNKRELRTYILVISLTAAAATLVAIIAVTLRQPGLPDAATMPAVVDLAHTRQVEIAQSLARVPARIAENVYLLGDMRPSTVYIVDTADGLAMIDTGLESAHDRLLAGMSKLGLDINHLKMILLTHAHGDHTMGAERLRAETGAKIYIGRQDAETVRRGGPWEAVFSKFDMTGETLHPTSIDGELDDEQVTELGQARFTVVATPGHTPGSCCFLLELKGQRILFTGDTISTFTVSTGTYAARLPPRYGGDVTDYIRSLEKLRQLPAPDLVLPGHPASDLATLDPHIGAAEWNALIDRSIADLQTLHERYARDGADFLDGSPCKILDEVYYLGDFDGQASYAVTADGRGLLFDGARSPDAAPRLVAAWRSLGMAPPAISAVVLTSCADENLTGLASLIDSAGCRVVVPHGGVEGVARHCPLDSVVVSVDELPALGWGQIHALPIAGVNHSEAAYYFRCGDATLLVSGSIPIDADAFEISRLSRQPPPGGWDVPLLADSLDRLGQIQPDVWLSSLPWHGRNANLYGPSWASTLRMNRQLLRHWQALEPPGRRMDGIPAPADGNVRGP